MLRDLLSSRWFQGGFAFFVLCVGGSLLYSWHVHRTIDAEFGKRPQPVVSPLKNKTETNTAPVDFQTEGVTNTPNETTDTQKPETTEEETIDETENLDIADAFLADDVGTAEEDRADFPEVPEGFPMTPVWADDRFPNYQKGDMQDHETISRVLIKLWNQGDHDFVNGVLDYNNGRVYPLYPDTLYVTWKEEVVDSPDGPRIIRYPGSGLGTHDRNFTLEERYLYGVEASYPDVNFVDKHTAGYDPETFLTDDKK
ncbi:hypothetical protein F4054_07315 [Candidatus Poribacteria bacterium]|nr:hypothetical protein [Candidatus Poribacteria bacterium]MYK22052.1 hypothetical protein [Candidatus Poribacteria bacterium]